VVVQSCSIDERHDTMKTYALLTPGTSCDDGILVTERCTNCSYTDSWESYGHDWNTEYLYMPEGTCGGHVEYYSCPCGEYNGAYNYTNCNFQYVDGEDHTEIRDGIEWYCENSVCPDCGLSYVRANCYVYEGNCQAVQYWTYSYYHKSEFIGEYQYGEAITDHQLSYASQLLEGSVTCSDGILVETFCDCGHTYNSEVYNYCPSIYATGANLVNTIDLAQYGACDGYIEVYECPCGLMSYIQKFTGCNLELAEEMRDLQAWIFYSKWICTDCGLTIEETITNERKDRCYCDEMANCKISINGTEIAAFDQRYSRAIIHENSDWEYVMDGTTCVEGVTVTQTCRDCDYVDSWYTTNHCYVDAKETVVLPEGSCGGSFILKSCLCDESTQISEETDCVFNWSNDWCEQIDGVYHDYYEYTCSKCGIRYVEETYSERTDTGTVYNTIYTIYNGDTCLGTLAASR